MTDEDLTPQQWYYSKDGCRKGPYSSKDLRAAAVAGRLTPEDMVWKEGMPKWVKASKVRGLFSSAAESVAAGERPSKPVVPDERIASWLNESAHTTPQVSTPARTPLENETKACPYCGETILAVARKCKHCGEFLDESQKKPGKAVFRASGDFIGLLCSYHIMDCNRRVLAKIKPHESFHVDIAKDTVMYVYNSGGFGGPVRVDCHAHTINRFSVCPAQTLFGGCVVARVGIIDSD